MRKRLFVLSSAIILAIVFFGGCASTLSTATASNISKLKAEPMTLWNRPLEIGFTVVGMGEGSSETYEVKVVDSAPSFFIGGSIPENTMSPMVKLAAFNAIQTAKADGIYITMAKEEGSGSHKKAWVKGLLLKIGIYGPVSLERSDAARMCKCGKQRKDCKSEDKKLIIPKVDVKPEEE